MTIAKDNGAVVGYKAWMPVDGGGSETIDITLPLNATGVMMDEAIAQWQNMRDKALPALRQAIQVAQIQEQIQDNLPIEEIKIPFGKYKGATLGYIYKTDSSYLDWIANKADPERVEAIWRERAKQILANPPGASFETANEDIPF